MAKIQLSKLYLPTFLIIQFFNFAFTIGCQDGCKLELLESIPIGLNFNSTIKHKTTFEGWKELISLANNRIQIGSYYWTLRGNEYDHESADQGKEIFSLLENGLKNNNFSLSIAKELDSLSFNNSDTKDLEKAGANVRSLNFTRLIGSGILHTKMIVVDGLHAYIGSANFDWRALTQVKELGIFAKNCSCIAQDLEKAFDIYWELGRENATIPEEWDANFENVYNIKSPMEILSNKTEYAAYISSSPPQFCPKNRTSDLESIFEVIESATEYINIAVMDYFPLILFDPPVKHWGDIDNKLREVAINKKVKVKLLMALWNNTRANAFNFLQSLQDITETYPNVTLEVRLFEVPSTEDQSLIPFARVNHNKYMVTDKAAYIGTSNWSGDYFISTGGIAFVIKPKNETTQNIRAQLADIFQRDWDSAYAKPITFYTQDQACKSQAHAKSYNLLTIFITLSVIIMSLKF